MFGIDAMTPADFRRPSRSRFLPGVKFTLVVAAAAWLAATTTARAQETDYVLSNVSAVLNGTPVSISGSFTVETGLGTYLANIQVTAPPFSPYGGGYFWDTCPNGGVCDFVESPNGVVAYSGPDGSGNSIEIGLAGGSITSVAIKSDGTTVTDSAPTGAAVVVGRSVDYNFSSNASTVLNGKLESISGYFTFDPLTDIEYIAQIQLTGPAPYDYVYGFDTEREGPAAIEAGISAEMQMVFANNLSLADDPLASVTVSGTTDTAPTGFVCPGSENFGASCPATVPEPTSLALLGAALGLFLVSARASRRAGKPHRDQPEGA
jgi:hypothetical protein